MRKKSRFSPSLSRIELNAEQAVLMCSGYKVGEVWTFPHPYPDPEGYQGHVLCYLSSGIKLTRDAYSGEWVKHVPSHS